MRVLPPTIAVIVSIMDHRAEKLEVTWKIPQEFDFSKYIYEEGDADDDINLTPAQSEPYEVFAIVSMDGPDLKYSSYHCLVKKHDFDAKTAQWYDFSG